MRGRYQKYKGRYADLAKHYRELEREREKVKVRHSSCKKMRAELCSLIVFCSTCWWRRRIVLYAGYRS